MLANAAVWFGPLAPAIPADEPATTFTLRDYLGKNWEQELVYFSVAPGLFEKPGLGLIGPGKNTVPFQWVPADQAPGGKDAIAFQATLPTLGESVYQLETQPANEQTDLGVTESPDLVEITNHWTGIRLYAGAQALTNGPIAGVRLNSGRWVGGGEIQSPQKPVDCSVKVIVEGPVFAEALVTYTFPNAGRWQLKFRLVRDEPVVLIEEEFNLPADCAYQFHLGKGFEPDRMFSRDRDGLNVDDLGRLKGGHLFELQPWIQWWRDDRPGNWTSFYRADGPDLLAIGCRDPGAWVEPGRTLWPADVEIRKADVTAHFQLRGFARKWLLAALQVDASLSDRKHFAPLPQQYLDKYGESALNDIKDLTLEWPDTGASHPRLFVKTNDVARFRAAFKLKPGRLKQLQQSKIYPYSLDEPVAYYLATGDKVLGRLIGTTALGLAQDAVDLYTRQDVFPSSGCDLPRHYNVVTPAVNLADLALAPGLLTPEETVRLRAQLAYLTYTLADPKVLSPERQYSANPNMTSSIRSLTGITACAIPDHPQAGAWVRLATQEMTNELENWTGPNGGWLEAPHYMTVSMDAIVPLALALRGSGLSQVDWAMHPNLRQAVAWLAKISTPPDSRLGGDRALPAIGNTYTGERTCVPGWLARIWRDADPGFASQMQWAWQQQGRRRTPGIGGVYPGTAGYGYLMFDETIPAIAPPWGSESFPGCGAVLRGHFPGDREMYLYLIEGKLHEHYDYDEGSIVLWGKGRPLCEEFGYYARAPAAEHSLVDDGNNGRGEPRIAEFATVTEAGVDYVRGDQGASQRQIMLVKDSDPLGPNYFVMRDTVTNSRPATWRLWLATDETPPVSNNPVRAVGREDVDLAVYFAEPGAPQITTQQLARKTGASGLKSQVTTQWSLQLAMPAGQPVATVLFPVLKGADTPAFESLANGRGIKITTAYGTDYVFLASEPFEFQDEGIQFSGRAGALQIRTNGTRLSLPVAGRLEYDGKRVDNDGKQPGAVSRWFPQTR